MRQTIVGVFDRYADAQRAAEQLRSSGFSDSVFVTDESDDSSFDATSTARTPSPEGEGVMAHVKHFFSDLFNDDDAPVKPYAEAVRRGGALVKVDVDAEAEAEAARAALEAAGAVDIDERAAEWRASGWSEGVDPLGLTTTSPTALDAGTTQLMAEHAPVGTETARDVLPVVQEELQVGKRAVSTGVVRVYSRTIETPVEESIELKSEFAQVERRPVDRAATAADLNALQDRTIEVRETAEQPVVAKIARVVEEVSIGKGVEHHTEIVSDTVRNTTVDVQRSDDTARSVATPTDFDSYGDDYRTDFQTRYGTTDGSWNDYEPAYRYGHGLGADPRYAGRSWDDFEPDARKDWESRNSGGTWEKMKAAVRHGWEKVTG